MLSGVGLTWYTWLEQGRDIPVSEQTVRLLAKALRLNPDEQRHLRRLAGLIPMGVDEVTAHRIETVQRMLDNLLPNPAYVLNRHFDYVAWNDAYTRVYRGFADVAKDDRNLVYLMFSDPHLRELLLDWESRAYVLLAQFRAAAGKYSHDSRFEELAQRLRSTSPRFREWWSQYPVMDFRRDVHRLRHPEVGRLTVEITQLRIADHPTLRLVLQTPLTPEDRATLERLVPAAARPAIAAADMPSASRPAAPSHAAVAATSDAG